MPDWQTKSSKIVYENPWMVVHEDTVITPEGKDGLYGYVESTCGAVNIVPIDEQGNTYLVEQYRYPGKSISLEVIGGRTDSDTPEDAARRELLEESGLSAKSLTRLSEIELINGITTFKAILYVAQDIHKETEKIHTEEGIIRVIKLPLEEAIQKVVSGEIKDAQSVSALFMAANFWKTK